MITYPTVGAKHWGVTGAFTKLSPILVFWSAYGSGFDAKRPGGSTPICSVDGVSGAAVHIPAEQFAGAHSVGSCHQWSPFRPTDAHPWRCESATQHCHVCVIIAPTVVEAVMLSTRRHPLWRRWWTIWWGRRCDCHGLLRGLIPSPFLLAISFLLQPNIWLSVSTFS